MATQIFIDATNQQKEFHVTSRNCGDWSTVLHIYVLAFQSLCDISSDRCIVWTIFLDTSVVEDMSWGRNSVGEERLTGLAMMNIHRDIHLDVNELIDRFASKKTKI